MNRILLPLLIVSLGSAMACGRDRPPQKFQQRLVIIGFDGMDPRLTEKWIDQGKLPNLRRIADQGGGVHRLATTHSPESPTAWASFATRWT